MDGVNSLKTTFSDLGIGIEIGSEMFEYLGVKQSDLMDPMFTTKLKTIATFLKNEDDPSFLMERITRNNNNPNISQIDHMHRFVRVAKERDEKVQQIDNVMRDITGIENYDSVMDLVQLKTDLENNTEQLDNEINSYLN